MGIEVASSFTRKAAVPIDEGSVVADLTARNAIESGIRYEGMIVYVESEQTNFQLVGGITNDDWEELSGSMGEFPTVSGIAERDAIPLEQRAWGKLFYDLQQLKYWYMPSGADLEDNDYWQALGKPAEWSHTFTGPSYSVSFGNDPIHYIRVDTDGGPQAVDLQNGKPQQIVFLKGTSDTNYPVLSKSGFSWTHLPADIEIKKDVLVQLYWDQDMSRWVPVGGVGSGSGALNMNHEQINLVPNPRGAAASTAGWEAVTYSAASKPSGTPSAGTTYLSISSEQGSLSANGSTKLKISKGTGNAQGEAVEIVMPVPEGYQASVLSLNILYKTDSADFTAGSLTDYSSLIFYSAQSNDGENFTMLEPSSFRLLSKGIPDTLRGYVQVGHDTTHLKLIAYVARDESGAWDLEYEASISKASHAYGSATTDWQDYPAQLVDGDGTPITNVSRSFARWRQVGDSLDVDFVFSFTGTPAAFTSMNVTIPPGFIPEFTSDNPRQITGPLTDNSTLLEVALAAFIVGNSIRLRSSFVNTSDAGSANDPVSILSEITNTAPFAITTSDTVRGSIKGIKIKGWSAGAQLADGYDGRVIAFDGTFTNASIAYGTETALTMASTVDTTAGLATLSTVKTKSPGLYEIDAGVTLGRISGSGVISIPFVLDIKVNGTIIREVQTSDATHSTKSGYLGNRSPAVSGKRTIQLKADDIVSFTVTHYATDSSGNSSVKVAESHVTITKLSGSAFMSPTAVVAAKCKNSSTQSVSNSATAILVADTVEHDTHGLVTLGASTKSKIQEAGLYEFKAQVDIDVRHNAAAAFSHIFIKKNGTDILCDKYFEAAADEGAAIQHDLTADGDAFLGAGDELTAEYTNGSGNTATVKLKAFSIKKGK